MLRWIVVLAAAALAGCATDYRGYGYGYYGYSDYYEPYYDEPYEEVYVDRGTYYRPVDDRYGDYYYRSPSYYSDAYVSYSYPLWWDYPSYYSLFWGLNRSVFDPYWHPGFYYGVTYFPRNYFSISWYGGWPRTYGSYWPYRSLWYSPYRSSWVDNYYDWYPYYRRYDRHYPSYYAPRYGNARNEAERLSRLSQVTPTRGLLADGLPVGPSRYTPRSDRNQERAADYRGRTEPRLDPGLRGYERRTDSRQADTRRSVPSERLDPRLRGVERPVERPAIDRSVVERRRELPVLREDELRRRAETDPRRRADYGSVPAERAIVRQQPTRELRRDYPRVERDASGYDPALRRDWRSEPRDARQASRTFEQAAPRGPSVRTPPPERGYLIEGYRSAPRTAAPREWSAPAPERRAYAEPQQRATPRQFVAPPRQTAEPRPAYRDPPPARAATQDRREARREERRDRDDDDRQRR